MSEPSLKIKSVIGFSGKVKSSLHYTPDGRYIIYPLGSFVVLKNLVTEKEAFLDGHTDLISCLTISTDGSKAASGQKNISGVKVSEKEGLNSFGLVLLGYQLDLFAHISVILLCSRSLKRHPESNLPSY